MTAIWSAKDSASAWSCVTSRVVTSVAASAAATSARVSARSEASSAENGSSSRTSRGSRRQRPGQRHPLLLAAGQLVRVAVDQRRVQADQLQQVR